MLIDFGNMYNDKPKMIMLVGIPGSGKTSIAHQMAEEYGAEVFSSDKKRKELYGDESIQGDPQEVFINLHKDILHSLRLGHSIIYDATNIRRKNREGFLKFLKQNKVDCYRIAWVIATPFEECVKRDEERERHVGKEIMTRMIKAFDFPQYFEGWNEILIWNAELRDRWSQYNLDKAEAISEQMQAFDQDNPWHFETVGAHSYRVMHLVWDLFHKDIDQYHGEFGVLAVEVAAMYHDVGKLFTQTFDEAGVAHYYGHANVSCYYLASHLDIVPSDITAEELQLVLFLVNYHMLPYNLKTKESEYKWREKFGRYYYDALMLLHKADKESTSEETKRNATDNY